MVVLPKYLIPVPIRASYACLLAKYYFTRMNYKFPDIWQTIGMSSNRKFIFIAYNFHLTVTIAEPCVSCGKSAILSIVYCVPRAAGTSPRALLGFPGHFRVAVSSCRHCLPNGTNENTTYLFTVQQDSSLYRFLSTLAKDSINSWKYFLYCF